MERTHIAIFTIMTAGHVNPLLGLSAELVQRGHRVTFPTDSTYAPRVEQTGAVPILWEPVSAENTLGLAKDLDQHSISDRQWWSLRATILYPWFLLNAAAELSQLKSVYENDVPDVILYDRLAFAGRILGRHLNAPLVQCYPHFAYYKNQLHRDNGICFNPPPILEFAKLLDVFMSGYGITDRDNLWHTEQLNIFFLPRHFQFHEEWFDDRYRFVGACLNRPFRALWKRPNSHKPVILVSDMAGGRSGYFNLIIDALSGLDAHIVLSLGSDIGSTDLRALPANFEINHHASHLEILPHTDLAICQGGMGSTLEALYHGVPVIALPLTRFHDEVAYRTVELGLGLSLPRVTVTADEIRACVETSLTDTALRSRVKEEQAIFRAADGARLAADAIEGLLTS